MKYIYLLLLMGFAIVVNAQSASDLYSSAKDAYGKGDYSGAISLLERCESLLGRTNPKIESLRSWCYYNSKDLVHASVSLKTYFKIARYSNTGSNAHNDLLALYQKVEEEIKIADQQFEEKRDEERMKDADQFVNEQETEMESEYNRMKAESERMLYPIYSNSADPEELQSFLEMFPNSSNADKIKFRKYVAEGDIAAENSEWSDAVNSYSQALRIMEDDEVSNKLYNAKDESAYQVAHNENTVDAYENYLQKYPSGNHQADAEKKLLSHYLAIAESAQKEFNHDEVRRNVDICYERFKNTSAWDSYQKFFYDLIQKESNLLTTGKKDQRVKYVSYAIYYNELLYNHYHGTAYKSEIAHLKRRQKAWSRPDYTYFGYRRGINHGLGFDFGVLANSSYGGFISFHGTGQAVVPGYAPNEQFEKKGREYSQGFFTLNFSKKLFHPLHVYVGAGYAYFAKFEPVPGSPDKVFIPAKEFVRRSGALNLESGIIIGAKPLTLSVGVSMPQFPGTKKELLGFTGFPMILNFAVGLCFE